MRGVQVTQRKPMWQTAPELPEEVLSAWRKPDRAISPVAILATIDPDGAPRTAPFGSLRAVTSCLLRLCSWRGHETYANLCRNGQVSVALISPGLAVSVHGRARVVCEQMDHDEAFAILEIDVDQVKNDMAYRINVDCGIEISARAKYKAWYDAAMAELEALD